MSRPSPAPAYAMSSPFDRRRTAPPQSGSIRLEVSRGDAADAADAVLAFLEGLRKGWDGTHVASWARSRLLRPGYLRPWEPASGTVTVAEGTARAQVPTWPTELLGVEGARDLEAVARTARKVVIAVNSALLASPADDRFLSAAIYAGRVIRARPDDGRPGWEPSLREGENLSQWLLAMLAADILTRRDVYDTTLCVCERCGTVELRQGGGRRRCADHKETPGSGDARRTTTARPPFRG